MSTEKKKTGRPSKFDTINQEQLKQLVLDGWIDKKVSVFFNINMATLYRWKNEHKEFCDTLKDWKRNADLKVEKSLYKRACGFKYDEVTYEKSGVGGLGIGFKKGKVSDVKHVDTHKTKIVTKVVVPDPTSMIFWLKNRQPDKWRDKKDVEVTELTPEEKRAKLARIKAIIGSDNE